MKRSSLPSTDKLHRKPHQEPERSAPAFPCDLRRKITKPQPEGCGSWKYFVKDDYRLSLRRNRPASPITPEPNNIKLPGSGVT